MQTPTTGHATGRTSWRSLTLAEKQRRLAGLRQRQQAQIARDGRVLTDWAHGAATPR